MNTSGADRAPGLAFGRFMLICATCTERLAKAFVITRQQRTNVAFRRPFRLNGVDRVIAAGTYNVVTDEELIEGLSFAAYRRVATMIFLPNRSAVEMVAIEPADLAGALERDAAEAPTAADPS